MRDCESDTIAAISTPRGEGGIGIVRISGAASLPLIAKLFFVPRKPKPVLRNYALHYGFIKDDATGELVDEVIVAVMKAPHSYTREDVVEIQAHGGTKPVQKILQLVLRNGARLAGPGEFTQRAFINGRIDLTQAQAVIELIRAKTDASLKIALDQLQGNLSYKLNLLRNRLVTILSQLEAGLDFAEEVESDAPGHLKALNQVAAHIEALISGAQLGKVYREGFALAIIGKPNVGKSSLLNFLLGENRAIVTDVPGTTRDTITEWLDWKGLPCRIIDTAGLRPTSDLLEGLGVERTRLAINEADIVIVMLDASRPLSPEDTGLKAEVYGKEFIVVLNKIDLGEVLDMAAVKALFGTETLLKISVKHNLGVQDLEQHLKARVLHHTPNRESFIITQARHLEALERARLSIQNVIRGLSSGVSEEFLIVELNFAITALGELTGANVTEEVLSNIFSEFCIGK